MYTYIGSGRGHRALFSTTAPARVCVYMSVCLSVCLSDRPSVHPSVCLSVCDNGRTCTKFSKHHWVLSPVSCH